MAVIDVTEGIGDEGSIDRMWVRNYTRVFQVTTNDRADGVITARSDPRIPPMGAVYISGNDVDLGAFVESIQSKRRVCTPDGSIFDVTCQYGPYDPKQWPDNPLEWPIEMSWSGTQREVVLWFDRNGKSIVNSAGLRFVDPVTYEDTMPILTMVRNEAVYSPSLAFSFNNKINSDDFLGAGPGQVKVSFIPGKLQFKGDYGFYFSCEYTFQFKADGWTKKILDSGFSYLDGMGQWQTAVDSKGQTMSDPVNLNGHGGRLASSGTPVALEFEVYEEINFADSFNFDFSNVPGLGSF